MPNKTPLLPDSLFTQNPTCQRCGKDMLLARMLPAGEPGRFIRTFECSKCGTTFETTDKSDAEIQSLAERLTGKTRPRR